MPRPKSAESLLKTARHHGGVPNPDVVTDVVIPNLSGDLSHGNVRTTPSAGTDPVNKDYVDAAAGAHTPEGTAVKSTGEGGGTKFLREDGDGTCSWQLAAGAGDNLGDHEATEDLDMKGFDIDNVSVLGSEEGDALIDLEAAEDVFHIKPGASAGNNFLIIESDSDGADDPTLYPSSAGEGEIGKAAARWNNIYSEALDVSGNITVGGTVDGVDIAARDHAEAHTVVSHSDTTGTGGELDTLTDGSDASALHVHTVVSLDTTGTGAEVTSMTDNSMADTLHRHSELSASDGTPDAALQVDASGVVTISTAAPGVDTQYTAQVLYNTDAAPPAAGGFPVGTIYIQYTA